MKITNKGKRNLITFIIVFSVAVLLLLCVILSQTIKVNNLKKDVLEIDKKIEQQKQEIKNQEQQIEFCESGQYEEDFIKYESGYSDQDNLIIYK